MLSALGTGILLAALGLAAFAAIAAFASRSDPARTSRALVPLAYLFAGLMTAAVLAMEAALVLHDFSVGYVAQVGARAAPLWIRVVSLWSALEGSILLWGFILAIFLLAAARKLKTEEPRFAATALGVLFAIGAFFCLLLIGPANPFSPVSPVPLDGPGPNPLLQNHLLMVIHPPILYLGYVGMAAPFAIAAGALVSGRLDARRLTLLRRATLIPWAFLTLGIGLGSLWAYEVLGWGGYWAWDPVENASLLPWLTATAALHSLLVTERRGALKGWSMTLVSATFLLTILGTFMTRSGLFNSVHAFSQSSLGPAFLAFMGVAALAVVILLSTRLDRFDADRPLKAGATRDTVFLLNNVVLVTLTLTILLGTVYPLLAEAATGVRLSVGEPYFDTMAVPIGVALLFLMAVGPALPWGRPARRKELLPLAWSAAVGLVPVGILFAFGVRSAALLATVGTGVFALALTLLRSPKRPRTLVTNEGRRRLGGALAHVGLVIVLLSVGVSSSWRRSLDVSLLPGESGTIGGIAFKALGVRTAREPHRQSMIASMELSKGERRLGTLEPRINFYPAMREPVGTPAVWTSPTQDLYLSLLSADPETGRVGLRAFSNPLVLWIWIGVALTALGGFVALASRPRVQSLRAVESSTSSKESAA